MSKKDVIRMANETIKSLNVNIKEAFLAGWEYGVCATSGTRLPVIKDAEKAYEEYLVPAQTRSATKETK